MLLGIGKNIVAMRKKRGLTQEQLAALIGVTAPAVSKWESGSGYPDITLVPAIARLFDVSIDELFDFMPRLTPEQRNEVVRACAIRFRDSPFDEALAYTLARVREYPNDPELKYEMCRLLDRYIVKAPNRESTLNVVRQQAAMLEHVSQDEKLRTKALVKLGYKYLQLEDFTRAEEVVSALPEHDGKSADSLRVVLYIKMERYDDAMALAKSTLSTSSVDTILALLHLCKVAQRQERFKDALRLGKMALSISVALSYHWHAMNAHLYCLRAQLSLGAKEEALDHLEAAIECARTLLLKPFPDPLIAQENEERSTDNAFPLRAENPALGIKIEQYESELGREKRFHSLKARLSRLRRAII